MEESLVQELGFPHQELGLLAHLDHPVRIALCAPMQADTALQPLDRLTQIVHLLVLVLALHQQRAVLQAQLCYLQLRLVVCFLPVRDGELRQPLLDLF